MSAEILLNRKGHWQIGNPELPAASPQTLAYAIVHRFFYRRSGMHAYTPSEVGGLPLAKKMGQSVGADVAKLRDQGFRLKLKILPVDFAQATPQMQIAPGYHAFAARALADDAALSASYEKLRATLFGYQKNSRKWTNISRAAGAAATFFAPSATNVVGLFGPAALAVAAVAVGQAHAARRVYRVLNAMENDAHPDLTAGWISFARNYHLRNVTVAPLAWDGSNAAPSLDVTNSLNWFVRSMVRDATTVNAGGPYQAGNGLRITAQSGNDMLGATAAELLILPPARRGPDLDLRLPNLSRNPRQNFSSGPAALAA